MPLNPKELINLALIKKLKNDLEGKISDIKSEVGDGARGDKGDRGESIVGPAGPQGLPGLPGPRGEAIIGPKGETGTPGRDGLDGKDGENGQDGDIKDLSPDEIRDSLELLKDEDRLDASAIKNLEKLIKKLVGDQKTVYVDGGSSGGGRIVKSYDLSPLLNGVAKTFTLPVFWRVISVHSSSSPLVFRENTDYTTANLSITFTSEIDETTTLASGQTITIIYSE